MLIMDGGCSTCTSIKRKENSRHNVTAEEIQAVGEVGTDAVFCLREIWDEEVFPKIWKKSIIVSINKKHDELTFDNYRGITHLSHGEKIMAAVSISVYIPPLTSCTAPVLQFYFSTCCDLL